ncbi:MAG: sigma-70 family RNA polymerase sigma factor [Azospirillaceae bacterium]|nr:sigma-70 family RNA polymerase sigma factor [Azospirillaceae bacterium]
MKTLGYPHPDAVPRLSGTFKQAVALGIEAAVRHHLGIGHNVNSQDAKGQTPLFIAAAKGYANICAILLEAGADVAAKDCAGVTALDVAIQNKRSDVWELLQRVLKVESPAAPEPDPWGPSPPLPETVSIDVIPLNEEEGELDLSGWQPEVNLPPPPEDPLVLPDVRSTQRGLGEHIPIDLDEDWSDVEITLPELIARRRRRRDNEEETRWLGDASTLVLAALRDGEVPESLIESITPAMGVDGDDEGVVDYDAMLRMTLGDLGVRVGDDEDARIIFDGPDGETEERYSLEISEAMQFLRTCLERREEPLTQYLNALSNIKVLSREDEQAIGRAMEDGMSMALTAVASSSVAMNVILETVDQAERHEIEWDSVIADDPAYMDADAPLDDDPDDMPDEVGEDEAAADILLPAALSARITSLREGYAALGVAAPEYRPALTQELGRRIQALGLREKFVERLRSVVEDKEADQAIRERLSAGLEKTRKAKDRLFHSNQKMVFWIARKYQRRGLPLMDIVQEGSLGLMKAVEKFDYSRGNKFSTYATWWIRQGISRAIADQSRLIRVPVHMVEFINKVRRARQEHEILRGREPTAQELAAKLEISEAKAAKALVLLHDVASLDEGDANENRLSDVLVDSAPSPEDGILQKEREAIICEELSGMDSRDQDVICLRFGIGEDSEHTLEEVGQRYGVTRERIRQIESKALAHLSHPLRLKKFRPLL